MIPIAFALIAVAVTAAPATIALVSAHFKKKTKHRNSTALQEYIEMLDLLLKFEKVLGEKYKTEEDIPVPVVAADNQLRQQLYQMWDALTDIQKELHLPPKAFGLPRVGVSI
jgi:hypothetical protein